MDSKKANSFYDTFKAKSILETELKNLFASKINVAKFK